MPGPNENATTCKLIFFHQRISGFAFIYFCFFLHHFASRAILSVRVFNVFAKISTFNALYCFCIAENFKNSRLEFQQFSF